MWIDVDECAAGRRYVEKEGVMALCSVTQFVCVCVWEGIKTHRVMLFYMMYHANKIYP